MRELFPLAFTHHHLLAISEAWCMGNIAWLNESSLHLLSSALKKAYPQVTIIAATCRYPARYEIFKLSIGDYYTAHPNLC